MELRYELPELGGAAKILGIRNRTEAWKTAEYFSPLFGERRVHLAKRLGEPLKIQEKDVKIELHWYGVRDYVSQLDQGKEEERNQLPKDLAERYRCFFGDLRESICRFSGFWSLQDHNYDVSTGQRERILYDNLRHTEIDIVLETPQHLFIGEAKVEMTFGAKGDLVLVHQLIRQYVMAKVLVDLLVSKGCPQKKVAPFVVGDTTKLKRNHQVKFMLHQGWLEEENILGWEEIKGLGKA